MIQALCFTHHPTFSFYHYLIFCCPQNEKGLTLLWGLLLGFAVFFAFPYYFTVIIIMMIIIIITIHNQLSEGYLARPLH